MGGLILLSAIEQSTQCDEQRPVQKFTPFLALKYG
jgi:hypothetical protein